MGHPAAFDSAVFDLTEDEVLAMQRGARLEWAAQCAREKDILGWGKALMPDKFELPFCRTLHDYLIDQRHAEFEDTEAPRNHAKTLIGCNLIPMFQGIYEPRDFLHYLNIQATQDKAQSVNVSMKNEFETNDLLEELIGVSLVGKERWTDHQFVLPNGVCYTAISAGQSIRGINWKNRRPDYVMADDLYNDAHITNVLATLKLNAWWWGTLYPARAKSRRTSIHMRGTAINNYDLLEKAKKVEGVTARTFKALLNEDTKEVLWPELNTYESLMADKSRMGSVIFYREMQNERRDDTTALVKHAWLYPKDGGASWEYDPAELIFDRHHQLAATIITCDPSIGEKVQNDFCAVMLIYRARYADGKGDFWYIHDVHMEHLSLDKRIKLLEDVAANQPSKRRVTQVRIESIAGFKDFTAEVRRRTNLPVQEVDHVPDKIANLTNKSHYFENRKVRINAKITDDLKDLVTYQLTTNYPQNDDLRDAVLLALDGKSGLWNFVK